MWKAALLTLGLLVALVDRVRPNDGHPSFYGVKLCGREFIRAVIFTCGGSRWRRSAEDSGKTVWFCVLIFYDGLCFQRIKLQYWQIYFLFFLSAFIGEETYDPWKANPIPQLMSEQGPAETEPWKNPALDVASVAAGLSRSARSPITEEVLEALRSADRKGRDVVVGLSNACCKWGCSKSEISSLCWTSIFLNIHPVLFKMKNFTPIHNFLNVHFRSTTCP